MPPRSSSSPLLLLLPLLLLPRGGAPDCGVAFRAGRPDFVLDVEASVRGGAALLATELVASRAECESACCELPRCNLALLEPRAENRTCDMFDCVYGNRFVCRFAPQAGYLSYVTQPVFRRYLDGPQTAGKLAPPIADAGRDVVVQPGETVTLNGIESLALADAKIVEYDWSLEDGSVNVIMEETELPDQMKLSNLEPGLYVFQLTVTDSNRLEDHDFVRVQVLNPHQSGSFCLSPVKVGSCRAAFPRWYYNAVTRSCELFMFGGCKPNRNNYLSKDECLAACRGVTAPLERSLVPPSAACNSTCRHDHLVCNGSCCLDVGLECDGTAHCSDGADEKNCSKLTQTLSRLLSIDVSQEKAQCTQPPHTGPCRASHARWYYDPMRTKCYRFVFGGCDENENNFESEAACLKSCDGVTESSVFSRGMFQRYESDKPDEDHDHSANIALAVILTVAILALVAVAAYCVLKTRRQRSLRPAAPGPDPAVPSEQDTLVYNSTTKPV